MKYINHLILNSGHTEKSYRNQIDQSLLFTFTSIYKDSIQPNGVTKEICGKQYNIHTTLTSNGGLTTLCAFIGNTTFPVLSTGYSDLSLDIYYELYDACKEIGMLEHNRLKTPQIPYCCDASTLLGTMVVGPLPWIDDFCCCMAWCGIDELKRRRNSFPTQSGSII